MGRVHRRIGGLPEVSGSNPRRGDTGLRGRRIGIVGVPRSILGTRRRPVPSVGMNDPNIGGKPDISRPVIGVSGIAYPEAVPNNPPKDEVGKVVPDFGGTASQIGASAVVQAVEY